MFQAYLDYLNERQKTGLLRTLKKGTFSGHDFTSNDPLGLSEHPALLEAMSAFAKQKAGSSSSRVLSTDQALFSAIEEKIAHLKGTETALLFASGFQANVSVLHALLDQSILKMPPLVFTDKMIHASMHLGCQLAKAHQIRFHHQDLNHLSQRLEAHKNQPNPKFILVESLYGMEGTVTDFETLVRLANEYGAFLYVDEAHATGVYGHMGGGFTQAFAKHIPCVLGTFSKALGSFGGFIGCSEDLKTYLLNRCQGLIYSSALPPALLGAHLAALDLMPHLEEARSTLKRLSGYAKQAFARLPFAITPSQSHIFGMIIPDIKQAESIQTQLKEAGFLVSLIRPPTVPVGTTRLRVSLSIKHSTKSIDGLANAMQQAL